MKKIIVILGVILLVLGTSACSKPSATSEPEKIATLTVSPLTEPDKSVETAKLETDSTATPTNETTIKTPSTGATTGYASPAMTLETMEDKLQFAESQINVLLKNGGMEDASFTIYSNDGMLLVVQIYHLEGTEITKKVSAFEQEYDSIGVLSADTQREWDALVKECQEYSAFVSREIHDAVMFQFFGVNNDVLLSINNDEIVFNAFPNN